jgi:hypothetical protein
MHEDEKREWLRTYRDRGPGTPIYVLSRGFATPDRKLRTEQILTLEPIGQVMIRLDVNARNESELVKHTYMWPLPTGDQARLADKAIWECTEFSASVPYVEPHGSISGSIMPQRIANFMELPVGSAVTLKYAHTQARGKKIALKFNDLLWDHLGNRILLALQTAGVHAPWLETLESGDRLKFSTEMKTAKAMTQHIYKFVKASASHKPDF